MIFSTVSAICNGSKIVINSFGAENTPKCLENGAPITNLPIPEREDGAKFLGWYYSLNFDEKFKAIEPNKFEYIVINAKYDKCYCFTLRYNVLGLFGKDTKMHGIHYYIPEGKYKVQMTDFSKADKGSITIYKHNSKEEVIKFSEIGAPHFITINNNEYLSISSDAVFLFQRADVDKKFVTFNLE